MSSSVNSESGGRKPQRRFQFIDNSDVGNTGANSTQVRRHVMQEYMREKRWENRTKAEIGVMSSEMDAATPLPAPVRRKYRPRQRVSSKNHKIETKTPVQALMPDAKRMPLHLNDYAPTSQLASRQQQADATQMINAEMRENAQSAAFTLKRLRDRPYLTPQKFAGVSNILPASLSTAPLTNRSPDPVPPQTWTDDFPLTPPGPISILSAARTDPFDSLPMSLSPRDQELFDFYATVMPACSYGFERRSPHANNWYLSVFIPEAMKSAVAFQNMVLVHAANTQAWVRGLADSSLAIEHRARASAMLSAHSQEFPTDISDAAISSALSAAALEDVDPRIERRQYAWLHWGAAMQKIRNRGGPQALEQNASLRVLIMWSDYVLSGYNGRGSTFYFDRAFSAQPSDDAEAVVIGHQEIARQCEELVIFLQCAEHLASVAAKLRTNSVVRSEQPLRYSIFELGQPLHTLLASPNGPRYTKTGQLKQIISRLAALMTINLAIWEYRYSSASTEDFFRELVDNIYHNDLDRHISVEALLQILLSGGHKPDLKGTERPWLVGRLLKVAKRLSRASWERLNDFLLGCLTLDLIEAPTMQAWEHELRNEILSAPLVNYVLPLMKE